MVPKQDNPQQRAWFSSFGKEFTHPEDYLVLDVATSGLNPKDNVIVGYGLAPLDKDRECKLEHETLNWFELFESCDNVRASRDLENKLNTLSRIMEEKDVVWPYHPEHLRTGGDPYRLLRKLHRKLLDAIADGVLIVVHTSQIVLPFVKSAASFVNAKLDIGKNSVYETGMVEKGSQYLSPELPMGGCADLRQFFDEVSAYKSYAPWSLQHCINKYEPALLDDRQFSHSSVYKALFIMALFEYQRGWSRTEIE